MKSLLCYSASDWSVVHDEIKFVWWNHYLLVDDFVQESQSVDAPMLLLQRFQLELLEQGCHTGYLVVCSGDPCCPSMYSLQGVLIFT